MPNFGSSPVLFEVPKLEASILAIQHEEAAHLPFRLKPLPETRLTCFGSSFCSEGSSLVQKLLEADALPLIGISADQEQD